VSVVGCLQQFIALPFNVGVTQCRSVLLDYSGNTEMAKRYGPLRIFLLRRAGDGKGPAVLGDIECEGVQ
jgi:hypothetical protein